MKPNRLFFFLNNLFKLEFIYERLRNLPILVRALLLHLDGLVQLAVRGAKVVVSLHG